MSCLPAIETAQGGYRRWACPCGWAVAALDGALAQYARTADMRQRAAQLRAELDQLEAQIGGQHVCTAPGCGRPFASAHALSVHRSRKHAEAAS